MDGNLAKNHSLFISNSVCILAVVTSYSQIWGFFLWSLSYISMSPPTLTKNITLFIMLNLYHSSYYLCFKAFDILDHYLSMSDNGYQYLWQPFTGPGIELNTLHIMCNIYNHLWGSYVYKLVLFVCLFAASNIKPNTQLVKPQRYLLLTRNLEIGGPRLFNRSILSPGT